ncbi:MAG: hypothetical protein HFH76_14155 [Lachnospiraceae bacterium]|nr:hypothetical protein [Lachnospiraceae bacterium]
MSNVKKIMSRYNSFRGSQNESQGKKDLLKNSKLIAHSGSGSSFAHCYG